MSTRSSEAAPPQAQEQPSALPSEADPSGLTERAPELASLLPDEALSRALAQGDAFAVHTTLTARLEREPPGPSRDTLQQLLQRQELFAVAERPPRLGAFLGTGLALIHLPPPDQQQAPFVATRALRLLGVPLWPLSQHLVRRGRDGKLEVLGRVPTPARLVAMQRASTLAVGALALLGLGGGLLYTASREVILVNGLSRAVEVRLDDRSIRLEPGAQVTEHLFSLSGMHELQARWPGAEAPFESLFLESTPRAVYNVSGAALLRLDAPVARSAPHRWVGLGASLTSEEQLIGEVGHWERTVREHGAAGRWQHAADVAEAVALADPSALRAREEALRWRLPRERTRAQAFIDQLLQRYPEDPSAHALAQDVWVALTQEGHALRHSTQWALQMPDSLPRALVRARSHPPEQQADAYLRVLERFPHAPEPKRALARLLLADGLPDQAQELLDSARETAPEASLEDLELRVRVWLALNKGLREASNAVRQYAKDPRHHSWELAVLAGQLDRLAGPARAQYITRDLLPPHIASSPEHMVAFSLLTGESTVKDEELATVRDPHAREALGITRELLTSLEKATARARTASEGVLARLPLEAAAVLALEFTRRGESESAQRLWGSHLSLWLARDPLERYLLSGVEQPRFALLPPGLTAAAHLIRAQSLEGENKSRELAAAQEKDRLGGLARRALDPNYKEHTPYSTYRNPRVLGCGRRQIIQIIKGSAPKE